MPRSKTKKRQITCIVCPVSCIIDAEYTLKKIKSLTGHQCKRGKVYANEELYSPMRTLTTTIKVDGGVLPLVSVRTDKAIPKELIFPIMDEIMQISLNAPIELGDIIIRNVKDTDANIIATKTVPKLNE
ncbi:DUF1667 domain-containing protein [[Eubacterium] cellulosolvens]